MFDLESEVDTQSDRARRRSLGIVNALHECTVGIRELRVYPQVFGDAEEVLPRDEDSAPLDEVPKRLVPIITECDIAQLDVTGILYPSVTESIVAHTVAILYTRHVGLLSLHKPSAIDRSSLVGEVARRLRDPSDGIVCIVAHRVGKCEVESEMAVLETSEH